MALTAGELKARLAAIPDNMTVVLASDAEGNKHAKLAQVDTDLLYDGADYNGEIYDPSDSYWGQEEELPSDLVPCVLLVPVN